MGIVFIAVDAATNYMDAIPCSNRSLNTVKKCLSRLFGIFGLPRTVVSDNALEFVALKEWLMGIGVRLVNTRWLTAIAMSGGTLSPEDTLFFSVSKPDIMACINKVAVTITQDQLSGVIYHPYSTHPQIGQ